MIRADAGVDVFSDNALHFAVLPPTTPSQRMRGRIPGTSVTSTTVLVIAGISTSAISRGLTHAATLSSSNGISVAVFDSLAYLPR